MIKITYVIVFNSFVNLFVPLQYRLEPGLGMLLGSDLLKAMSDGMRFSEFATVATVPWIWSPLNRLIEIQWLRSDKRYRTVNLLHLLLQCMNSIFCVSYSTIHSDESQPHDLKWTVEIACYRGLPAVASGTAEDPDPRATSKWAGWLTCNTCWSGCPMDLYLAPESFVGFFFSCTSWILCGFFSFLVH
jgi:hypothetical protein